MSCFFTQTPKGALATCIGNACRRRKSPLGDLGVKEKLMRHYFIPITFIAENPCNSFKFVKSIK